MVAREIIAVAAVALSLLAVPSAKADSFAWSYSGAPCTEADCGFGADLIPPQAMVGSGFLTTGAPVGTLGHRITSFAGTWNNLNITRLLPTNPNDPLYFFNDNVLFYPDPNTANLRLLDIAGLGFSLSDGTAVNLCWCLPPYGAFTTVVPPYGFNDITGGSFGTFSVTAVPGPIVGAGLPGLILASGGLLGWWRRRRPT
jgi:hypothetical protein